jgi:hypothetical protein
LGPTQVSLLAEIIEKPDNLYVHVASGVGLYGTGTYESVRKVRGGTSRQTREKNVDGSEGEQVVAQR